MIPGTSGLVIHAHGTGPGHDLPIPLFYAIAGGALAVFVSFVAVSLLWPDSRLRGAQAGVALPEFIARGLDAPATRWTLRLIVLVLTAFTLAEAVRLPDDDHVNPTASIVYAVFWVGLVVLSLAFGPVWRMVNPLRTIHELTARMIGRDPAASRRPLPSWIGYWPAAAGLLAFTWMELVSPAPSSTRTLLIFFVAYSVCHLAAAAVFGTRWFDRGDAFEVFSGLIGHLAFVGRRADRQLVVRNPLNGLDAVATGPGLAAVVCVMLASTGFDSVTTFWDYSSTRAGTVGLLVIVLAVFVAYSACASAAGTIGRRRSGDQNAGNTAASSPDRFRWPGTFAHSLVPIAVGYLIAHYLTYLIGESQRAVVLSLGTDWQINESLLRAGLVATIQVLAIVTGHVLGVVSAHDRAVRLFEPHRAVSGQAPMMVLMVALTIGGLTLLAVG